MKKTNSKYKVGSIVAIPLSGGRYAFAKIFKDSDLGVYNFISKKIEPLETVTAHKIAFFQPVTSAPIKSGEWPVIGEQPFPDEESSWGPPRAAGVSADEPIDPLAVKISHKGTYRRATPKEVAGMEIETFCQRPELFVKVVVDRLINGNNDDYRVKL